MISDRPTDCLHANLLITAIILLKQRLFLSRSLGTEWVPHDDDAERQAAVHLGQRGRVPGPLHGE